MSTRKRFTFLIALMIGALAAISGCGDSDPGAKSTAVFDSEVQSTTDSGSIVASGATDVADSDAPPEVSVVPKEIPEPGSVEEKVLAALERQVRSINTQDWDEFVAQCSTGSKREVSSVEQVKFVFEELGGVFGLQIPAFSIYGYNARDVEFTIYSADNARTTFAIYNHDEWVTSGVSRTFERLDGEWYSDGLECYAFSAG